MNNTVFGKTMENAKEYRDIKLVATDRRRNYLVSEPNYHTTKFFTEHILAKELKKTQILVNKPVKLVNKPNYKSEDQISGQEKLLNSIMIILEWYLRLNTNQFVEKGSKY